MNNVSVIILAKNESARIADCIESVKGWAGEILVFDDNSEDDTRSIAENLGARVITKAMDVEGKHRNWTYDQASLEWIFSLDADERLTPELRDEIDKVLSSGTDKAAFTVPRMNHVGKYWMRYGGQYPAAQIKLFRKGKLKWEEADVHPRVFLEGSVEHLTGNLIHFTYRDFSDWVRKFNNQSTLEAKKWHKLSLTEPEKAARKMYMAHALWRMIDRFFRAYIVKKGFMDGFVGFMNAYLEGFYQLVSYAKYCELKKTIKSV